MIETFALAIGIPGALLALIVIGTTILSVFYNRTGNRSFLIALIIYFLVMTVVYIILCINIVRILYRYYYRGLYQVTRENFKKLSSNIINLSNYPESQIKEFIELNKNIDYVKSKLDNALLITYRPDFSHIPLVYLDEDKRLITFESFNAQLKSLIFLSQSFRNVIIDVYYDLKDEVLSQEDRLYLLNLFNDVFIDYERSLFTFRDNGKSLLIYLPVIDSLSRIREQLEQVIPEASISIRRSTGICHVPAKFALVAYPYSNVNELMSDIRYAKRQGKTINFFLPNRILNNEEKKMMMHTSMNINYMSKLVSSLSDLNYNFLNDEHDKKIIKEVLLNVSNYLKIDESGIITYNSPLKQYEFFLSTNDKNIIDNGGDHIDENLINLIDKTCDVEDFYYFSKRTHANKEIGRFIDYYGLSSGFFFTLKKDGKPYGIIYFINQKHDLLLDAYLKESLFILCLRISYYLDIVNKDKEIDLYHTEAENILAISNYGIYRIDDETMEIKEFSNNLKTIFPNLKVGEPCYKAMYGLDKICSNCPMKNFKRKYFESQKHGDFEISLTLNDRKSHNRTLLVSSIGKDHIRGDMFDDSLLINSYRALVDTLRNSYYSNGRGYVLLLSFDNLEELIANQGSEGCLFVIRSFIRSLKNKLGTSEFYTFNNQTIALVIHNIGHADIINKCEIIYELSKEHFFDDGSKDHLNITYLPLGWPRGYATADDFMRHILDFYQSNKFERNTDFIYFADYSISRSASSREFMISVIKQEFTGQTTTSVSLQPIVRARDKKIFGAEMLLRINDAYRNTMLSAEELSHIAEQENLTSLITESLINFIGSMYQEYGNNIFKINAFKRICINIDQTYLRDESLIKAVIDLNEMYKLPDNFLSFEIPEDVISNYQGQVQKFARELAAYNIFLSCDRYTGKYISIERLKELGFKEVKLTRDLINVIDQDPLKLQEVTDILNNARSVNVGVTAVGVENSNQFILLRDINPDIMVQGYHFYKPLSRSDLITAIISHDKN